jgi:hypothetical protein
MKQYITKNGDIVLFDDEDFETYKGENITLCDGYPAIGTGNDRIKVHNLLCPTYATLEVDHINRNKLDLQKVNLRAVTHGTNIQNAKRRKDSTWPYKGVHLIHCGWQARITVAGKRITKAGFKTIEEAARWYDQKVDEFYPGGYKNFP